MTDLNLNELAAGPLLDRLVAERVMEWIVEEPPGGEPTVCSGPGMSVPLSSWRPSAIPDHALQALWYLQSEDWHVEACIRVERCAPDDEPIWSVTIEEEGGRIGTALDYGFALAISKAAVAFVGLAKS